MPKGYQISQYDLPFSDDGFLAISDPKARFEPKHVGIIRVHLEEDAGKSMHDEVAGKADSRIDLNRTGTPLLEIVSQPDLRSPLEAKAYLTELKLLLTYLGVSDCNMQEGSLRVDANINLHINQPDGHVAKTPIVEIKNMNSFRAVERALAYEADRQYEVWHETGKQLGEVPKQTRGWDDVANITRGQRHKEESSDYRYFPEPDLVPVHGQRGGGPGGPRVARRVAGRSALALEATYGISNYDSDVLVNQGRPLVDYFVELARLTNDGKAASNWAQQDVLRTLNERNVSIDEFPISPDGARRSDLPRAVGRSRHQPWPRGLRGNARQRPIGRQVIAAKGIAKVDESELIALCQEIVAANPKIVADIKGGKLQAAGNLVGQAKKRNPNVNPGRVREICLELAAKM